MTHLLCLKAHNLFNELKFLPRALANLTRLSTLCLLLLMVKIYNPHPVQCGELLGTSWTPDCMHHLIWFRCNATDIIKPTSREYTQGCQERIMRVHTLHISTGILYNVNHTVHLVFHMKNVCVPDEWSDYTSASNRWSIALIQHVLYLALSSSVCQLCLLLTVMIRLGVFPAVKSCWECA